MRVKKTAALAVEVKGGKAPFNYSWSKGLSGENPSGLTADDYSLTVTDAVGNTAIATAKVREPQALMIAAKVDAPCKPQPASSNSEASATWLWQSVTAAPASPSAAR